MEQLNKFFNKSIATLFFFVFFIFLLVSLSIRVVPAGTVHVVTQWGRVTGRVLYPGLSTIIPLVENTITYNTKKITYETMEESKLTDSRADYKDYPVDTTTKDGQDVKLTYTIRFRVDPTKATWLAENIGPEESIVEKVIKTDSRAWSRTTVRDFSSIDLYSGNIRQVQDKIFEVLRKKFENNGLLLDEIVLKEPIFSVEFENVMEAKQIAAEQVKIEKNKAEQEKYKKEQRITTAEGYAKEQELQKQTLTNEILKKMWIEKWDGKLPTYMLGSDANTLIEIPK